MSELGFTGLSVPGSANDDEVRPDLLGGVSGIDTGLQPAPRGEGLLSTGFGEDQEPTLLSPDDLARDRDLDRHFNLTPGEAQLDRDNLIRQKEEDDKQAETDFSPLLRGQLQADPELRSLTSRDDLKSLSRTERAARSISFGASFSNGVDILQGMGWRFVEVTGELTGLEGVEALGQEAAEQNLAAVGRRGHKLMFVDIQDAGDFFQWMKAGLGEQLPLMAPSLAGGVAGGVAGSFVPVVGTAIGAFIGAFIPSFILGVGETQAAIKERNKDVEAPGLAFGAGALIGLLDSALPLHVGTMLKGAFGREGAEEVLKTISKRMIAKNAALRGGQGMLLEGVTETVQEVISEAAAASATGTDLDTGGLTDILIEAFAMGAFMGGGVTSTVSVGSDVIKARRVHRALTVMAEEEQGSGLRQRASDQAIQTKVEQLQASGVDHVFVTDEALLEYAQAHPDGVEALANLGVSQSSEGGSVALPLEALVEAMGDPSVAVLLNHTTLEANDKSIANIADELSDPEMQADLAKELEAYDAAEELKEMVTQVVQAGTKSKKKGRDAIKAAPLDVQAVLADLMNRVADRGVDVSDAVVEGRQAQLDQDITEIDRQIDELDQRLERTETENAAVAPSKRKGTKATKAKIEKLVAKRDELHAENDELTRPAHVASLRPEAQENIVEGSLGKGATRQEALGKSKIQIKAKKLQDLGVKVGKEAIRAAREGFRAGLKAGQHLTEKKKNIVAEIKKLPLTRDQRGQLNNRINNAKTEASLIRTAAAVQSRAAVLIEKNRRAALKSAMKKVFNDNKPKKGGDRPKGKEAGFQALIKTLKGHLSLTAEKAEAKIEALGDPLTEENPTPLIERQMLAIAANEEGMTADIMEDILLDLEAAVAQADAAAAARLQKKRTATLDAQAKLDEAITDGEVTEEIDTVSWHGKVRKRKQQFRTILSSMYKGWDEILDTIAPTDPKIAEELRMTHVLQRFKGRQIQWSNQMDAAYDKAYGTTTRSQRETKQRQDSVRHDYGKIEDNNGKTPRLEFSKAEIRKLWMERQDPTIRRVWQDKDGNAFSDEMMRALFDDMTQQDYAFAQAQLDLYQQWYKQINKMYRETYGIDLPFNEFYSPIRRDKSGKTAGSGEDTFESADSSYMMDIRHRRKLPKEFKDRTVNTNALKQASDVIVMHGYINEMAYFLETQKQVMHIDSVFKSETVRASIEAHHGRQMVEQIKGFIDDFGVGHPQKTGVAEQFVATTNRRFASSVLALKPTIGAKQLVSWFAMSENIPTLDFLKYTGEFLKGPKEAKRIVELLFSKSPLLQHRSHSPDIDVAAIHSADKSMWGFNGERQLQELFFWFIKTGDRIPIYAGGWAVYQHALSQGKTEAQAIKSFEDMVNSTQQSSDLDKMSALQRSGAVGRALTMFMTARFSLLRGELRAIRHRPKAIGGTGKLTWREFGKRIAIYHFIMPQLIQYIASGFEWDEDRQLVAALIGQLNSFTIFGDILQEAITNIVTDEDQSNFIDTTIPVVDISKEAWRGVKDIARSGGDIEEIMQGMADLGGAVGQMAGQPADQVFNIIAGVNDIMEGDYEKGIKRIAGFSEKVAEESSE